MTTKGPTKQASVRIPDEMRAKLEQLAEQEGRTFSGQVTWLLRQALAARAFSKQQPSQQHAA
jgi:predicted DNA-binding protein